MFLQLECFLRDADIWVRRRRLIETQARYHTVKQHKIKFYLNRQVSLTWESFSPNFSANFFLSGFEMYFCIWNLFSSPFLCKSENTARLIIPLLGFPLDVLAQGKVPGSGNTVVVPPSFGTVNNYLISHFISHVNNIGWLDFLSHHIDLQFREGVLTKVRCATGKPCV